MNPALLLLADSRFPAGGHAHSGGTERAIASGAVFDVPSLARFLHGRLHTTGALTATLTAAAHTHATTTSPPIPQPPITPPPTTPATTSIPPPAAAPPTTSASNLPPAATRSPATSPPSTDAGTRANAGVGQPVSGSPWVLLDAEVDARTAAPAQRDASRTQGRLLLRVARRVWPSPVLEELARAVPSPHHPIALGAVAYAAGATAEEAAMAAAYHAISGPATAAVRLLGLDPVAVHGLLADLTPHLTAIATEAHLTVTKARSTAVADAESSTHPGFPSRPPDPADPRPWLAALPAYSSPALDLLAEQHARAEVRLFVS
ncbi:urease accessory protein UreF [Nonomuraea jabiensis]|uniref:Urease accessory protein UreF n=1 Tax=Nonomuraea jabiensis TaxID=882448 RepID=A0A7W9LCG3_9ACTN|nr:urease accessory UreF family protein [Nonomuraea jabiensis]MBB5778513.1 urease accessory protein [Nonomuraea jabiensis]